MRAKRSSATPRTKAVTVADSTLLWADPGQTLIFLDWDDTLFPTTEVFDRWGVPSRPEAWGDIKLTPKQELWLQRWQVALFVYLRTACSLSNSCVIVTNALEGWVDKCIDRFAPMLKQLFARENGPKVVYAREGSMARRGHAEAARGPPARYTDNEPSQDELHDQLTKAKLGAMRKVAKQFYSRYPSQTWKNILSVGDAQYEYYAVQDLVFNRRSPEREFIRLKTVTTPREPRLIDLTYRLRAVCVLWPAYVNYDGCLELDMNNREQFGVVAEALGMPELMDVLRPMPIPEEEEEAAMDDMDEIALIVHDRMIS